MKIGLLLIVFCFFLVAGCTRTSTMKVYSESAKDTMELHFRDVPTDSVCAIENRSKYPEDWTDGCDSYQIGKEVTKYAFLLVLAVPTVMIIGCLPLVMAGGK